MMKVWHSVMIASHIPVTHTLCVEFLFTLLFVSPGRLSLFLDASFFMRCIFAYLFVSYPCRHISFFQTECHSMFFYIFLYISMHSRFLFLRYLFIQNIKIIHSNCISPRCRNTIVYTYTSTNIRSFVFDHCFGKHSIFSHAGHCTLANYPSIFHFKWTISIMEPDLNSAIAHNLLVIVMKMEF